MADKPEISKLHEQKSLDFVRTMQAVELTDVTYNTFKKWVKQGLIKQHLFGGIVYYSISEINQAIKNS